MKKSRREDNKSQVKIALELLYEIIYRVSPKDIFRRLLWVSKEFTTLLSDQYFALCYQKRVSAREAHTILFHERSEDTMTLKTWKSSNPLQEPIPVVATVPYSGNMCTAMGICCIISRDQDLLLFLNPTSGQSQFIPPLFDSTSDDDSFERSFYLGLLPKSGQIKLLAVTASTDLVRYNVYTQGEMSWKTINYENDFDIPESSKSACIDGVLYYFGRTKQQQLTVMKCDLQSDLLTPILAPADIDAFCNRTLANFHGKLAVGCRLVWNNTITLWIMDSCSSWSTTTISTIGFKEGLQVDPIVCFEGASWNGDRLIFSAIEVLLSKENRAHVIYFSFKDESFERYTLQGISSLGRESMLRHIQDPHTVWNHLESVMIL